MPPAGPYVTSKVRRQVYFVTAGNLLPPLKSGQDDLIANARIIKAVGRCARGVSISARIFLRAPFL